MARTQQQRREETVARLLDASIATIVEVGYARASAIVITKRAQLSDGALFRHFPTMGDFMAATAHEVLRRQLELFTRRVGDLAEPKTEDILVILREVTGNPTNAVLYELLVAARTDAPLRRALRAVLGEYRMKIYELAKGLPLAKRFPEATFPLLVQTLTNCFDGAAILRPVLPDTAFEAARIPFLMTLLGSPSRGKR